jgi:hypothetical protein
LPLKCFSTLLPKTKLSFNASNRGFCSLLKPIPSLSSTSKMSLIPFHSRTEWMIPFFKQRATNSCRRGRGKALVWVEAIEAGNDNNLDDDYSDCDSESPTLHDYEYQDWITAFPDRCNLNEQSSAHSQVKAETLNCHLLPTIYIFLSRTISSTLIHTKRDNYAQTIHPCI